MAKRQVTTTSEATPAPSLSWLPAGWSEQEERFLARLRDARSILVVSHARPDADALGSTAAAVLTLRRAGWQAAGWSNDGIPPSLAFLVDPTLFVADAGGPYDLYLLVDVCDVPRVGAGFPAGVDRSALACIDHHLTSPAQLTDAYLHDPEAASTSELIYRLAVALQVPLDRALALPLYAALVADTGGFRYASTHAGTMELAQLLLSTGLDVWSVTSQIFENYPADRLAILARVLSTLERRAGGKLGVLRLDAATAALAGGDATMLHGLVNYARGVQGVEVAVLFQELGPHSWELSFRSRGRVDVSQVAAGLGGGGHRNAAGARVEGDVEACLGALEREVLRVLDG